MTTNYPGGPELKTVTDKVPFVMIPRLECPECHCEFSWTRIDELRIKIYDCHVYTDGWKCSRAGEEVIRPLADFIKFI